MLFPALLSAKVTPGTCDYQIQLQGAFLNLNVTSDGDLLQPCVCGEAEGFCITSHCPGERSLGQVGDVCKPQEGLPRGSVPISVPFPIPFS